MTPQQIEYVLTLNEEKSFSKAAERLYITQPSLSQFIKNLENDLNVKLFDRSAIPIQLTPAGETFVKAAHKFKGLKQELVQQLSDLTNLKTGDLRIGTSPFRSSCLLPKSIAEFHKKYNGVTLHIMEDESTALEKAAAEGSIDFYLGTGAFDKTIFNTESLAEEQLYLAVPPNSPLNNGLEKYQVSHRDITLDTSKLHKTPAPDLYRFKTGQFIFQKSNQKLHSLARDICNDSNFEPQIILNSERLETSFAWTLAGIGLSFIPDYLIRFGNYENHPIYYKLSHPDASRHICIAHKKNRYLSKIATEYIKILKQLIGHGTWHYKE